MLWALQFLYKLLMWGYSVVEHGAMSSSSGLLSVGVGVRWVVAGSLPNGVSVLSGRVTIMCGGASLWASTTMVLSASMGSTVFCEEWAFAPLDTAITPSNSKWLINKKRN